MAAEEFVVGRYASGLGGDDLDAAVARIDKGDRDRQRMLLAPVVAHAAGLLELEERPDAGRGELFKRVVEIGIDVALVGRVAEQAGHGGLSVLWGARVRRRGL